MERKDIFNKLNEIFEDVIDDGPVFLTETSNSGNINGWDSLAHIQLIVAIEKTYNVRFTSDEISTWKNVGEMIDCLLTK